MSPVPSVLPPLADIAAQNVLGQPTLRSLPALSLARLLAVPVPAAVQGIAAVVGLARARGTTPLQREPDLEAAIGPFMSTDTALARFGAHMGPIESNANPTRHAVSVRAGTIGGYAHRFAFDDYAPEHQIGIDNDAGGFPEDHYGDRLGGNEAGLGESPTVVVNDNPPSPSPSPAPSPALPSAPSAPSTVFGVPLLAVAAAAVGAYLLFRKKRRRR